MTDEELIARLNNIADGGADPDKATVLFAALRKIEQQTVWRNAVIDELTSLHIYSAEHDADPRKAVRDIVEWNQRLALDPAVSAEARALMVRGGEMVKEAFRSAFTELLTLYALKVDGMPLEQARIHAETAAALRLRALSVPAIVEAGEHQLKENTDG